MAVLPNSVLAQIFCEETLALCELAALWISITAGYFLPSLVAWQRGLTRFDTVLIINVVAGWTGVGWVMAWVSALSKDRPFEDD